MTDKNVKLPLTSTYVFLKSKKFFIYTFIFICIMGACIKSMTPNQKTFIFDFDHTITTATNSKLLLENLGVSSEKYRELKRLNLKKQYFEENITPAVLEQTRAYVANHFTPGVKKVIQKLLKNNDKVFIVGGGWVGCNIIPEIVKDTGIQEQNIFSGKMRFDNAGKLSNSLINGFVRCSENDYFTHNRKKSEVLKKLKTNKEIIGKVIIIGNGINDLEAFLSKQSDVFIGFGINKVNDEVQQKATYFVKNMADFEKILQKL